MDMDLTSLLIKKPTTVHACSYILDLTLEFILEKKFNKFPTNSIISTMTSNESSNWHCDLSFC